VATAAQVAEVHLVKRVAPPHQVKVLLVVVILVVLIIKHLAVAVLVLSDLMGILATQSRAAEE
jgi:hypothetical protein